MVLLYYSTVEDAMKLKFARFVRLEVGVCMVRFFFLAENNGLYIVQLSSAACPILEKQTNR